jgi:hypothetical protein
MYISMVGGDNLYKQQKTECLVTVITTECDWSVGNEIMAASRVEGGSNMSFVVLFDQDHSVASLLP